MTAVEELLFKIERPEKVHTMLQGVITSPHLSRKLLYYVLRKWGMYPNSCVDASSLEYLGAPGAMVPLSL